MLDLRKQYDSSYFWILIIGFILGLWAAIIVWGTQRTVKNSFDVSLISSPQNITTVKKFKNNYLTVSVPKDESVESSNFVTVTGISNPGSKVVVVNGWESAVTTTSSNGSFSVEVSLIEGVNDLKITAFSELGDDTTVTRTVIYSKESLD